jgi:predicted DNA-binding transcriptional regulator YafY
MTIEVRGTIELVPWIMGFGEDAVVESPATLRAEVGAALDRAARHYRQPLKAGRSRRLT